MSPSPATLPVMRPRFQWDLGRRKLALGEQTLVMGVLNVTPDSFSDGGMHLSPGLAVKHGLRLLDEGADILDIGGESTRPGVATATGELGLAGAVTAEEEAARILPVILELKRLRPNSILSVDTYKAEVARAAVEAGAEIVNDVSGFTWDAGMARMLAELGCGAVLMHTRGQPHQWRLQPPARDIVGLVRDELRQRLGHAMERGVGSQRIVLDPGFGFGKNFDENYPLLAHFAELQLLGRPLLAAVSRKSFLGRTIRERLALLGVESTPTAASATSSSAASTATSANQASAIGSAAQSAADAFAPTMQDHSALDHAALDHATLAATVAAVLAGAHIVRVHNVRPAVEALAVADRILAESNE